MPKNYLDVLIEIVSSNIEPENKISSLINNISNIWNWEIDLLKINKKNNREIFNKEKNIWEKIENQELDPNSLERMSEIISNFFDNGKVTLRDLFTEKYLIKDNTKTIIIHPIYPTKLNEMIFLRTNLKDENVIKNWEDISQLFKTMSLGLGFIHEEIETKSILSEMKTLAEQLEEAYKKLPQHKVRTKLKKDVNDKEIEEVCPLAFVGCMDEKIGPRFVETHPTDFNSVDNLIMVVSSYTSIDFEQVSNIGHVFSTTSVLKPYKGELMGLYFVIPNEKARGGFELHSIHLLISQPYENAMVFGSLEVRGFLFQAREEYLRAYEKLKASIITDEPSESELSTFQEEIKNILYQLKKDVSSFILGVIQQN